MTTVVVGAGQAGLAVSRELGQVGVEHVVLDRGRVAETWRGRWDSFSLVTPNWTLDLPGGPYAGDDPEGHVLRDEIVAYLERYADVRATDEIRTGVDVHRLSVGRDRPLRLDTSDGDLEADAVVVCTGAYQRPHRPAVAEALPADVVVIDATQYRHPAALPDGRVLVVGSGQTGIQLAEELHLAGREVVPVVRSCSLGAAPLGGIDIVTWLTKVGFYDQPAASLPSPQARLVANLQATGACGGHDLHYRVLQELGVRLVGHLRGVEGTRAQFADDLADSVAFGDARFADVRNLLLTKLGDAAPAMPDPEPFRCDAETEVDLRGFGAVVLTAGFRPDYASWVDFDVFDELGFPVVSDDLTTAVPGLYFCGVHFLRTRRSSLLFGVGEDARIVAGSVSTL